MDRVLVEGANGGLNTNYEGKADAAAHALLQDGYDFAYIHVEAPDEMGHQGSIENKIRAIEYLGRPGDRTSCGRAGCGGGGVPAPRAAGSSDPPSGPGPTRRTLCRTCFTTAAGPTRGMSTHTGRAQPPEQPCVAGRIPAFRLPAGAGSKIKEREKRRC